VLAPGEGLASADSLGRGCGERRGCGDQLGHGRGDSLGSAVGEPLAAGLAEAVVTRGRCIDDCAAPPSGCDCRLPAGMDPDDDPLPPQAARPNPAETKSSPGRTLKDNFIVAPSGLVGVGTSLSGFTTTARCNAAVTVVTSNHRAVTHSRAIRSRAMRKNAASQLDAAGSYRSIGPANCRAYQ
jgi:hypothetical protein